jgi:hypothetical protein
MVQPFAVARKDGDRRVVIGDQRLSVPKGVFQGEVVHGVKNAAMDFAFIEQTDFQADLHRNRMLGILFRSKLSYRTHASSSTPEMVELKSGKKC